jgi:hypothetical protein
MGRLYDPSERIWRKENFFNPTGFQHRTVQAVANCYTAYIIPAPRLLLKDKAIPVEMWKCPEGSRRLRLSQISRQSAH